MQPNHPQSTLFILQALRAFAAFAVVCYHVILKAQTLYGTEFPLPNLFPTLGRLGVDVFFVISGFIMVYTTQHLARGPATARNFMRRRIIRIVPLYWLFTTLVVILLLITPSVFRELSWDPSQIIASYLFFPVTNSIGTTSPLVGVGWTLNYEMYFYLIFALMLWLRAPLRTLVLFFAASVALGYWLAPTLPVLQLVTSPLLLEFIAGAIAATCVLTRPRIPSHFILIGTAMLILALRYASDSHFVALYYGTAIACIMAALVSLEQHGKLRVPIWLAELGNSSYSLYLSHVFTLAIITRLAHYSREIIGFYPFCILTALAAIAAGHIIYRIVERPMTRYLQRH